MILVCVVAVPCIEYASIKHALLKRRPNTPTKSIAPCQPSQSTQVDMGRYFWLLVHFIRDYQYPCIFRVPDFIIIRSLFRQSEFYCFCGLRPVLVKYQFSPTNVLSVGQNWARIHQPFSKTFLVFLSKIL